MKARPRWSLAGLLHRRLLATLAVLWLAGSALAVMAVRHEMNEVLDSALLSLADQIPLDPAAAIDDTRQRPPAGENEDVMHVLLRNARGEPLRQSAIPTGADWPLGLAEGLQSAGDWRVATRRSADGGLILQVGESMHERREALAESTLAMLLPLLALMPLAALSIHLLLRRSFQGVQRAGDEWRARPEADLSPLAATDLPTEFDPLIESINALVDRLRGVVSAERAFAASTAHELRTPVAAARAQAQRLVAELPDDTAREQALALLRSLDRVSNTATKLLQLARVESGIGLVRDPVDLRQLATLVLDEFRHQADAMHRLQVELPADPVMVRGDLDALGIAMRNLIENALRHAPRAQVQVRVESPGRVIVSDDGPGVPPGLLASLCHPFSRGPSAGEGTGLGLSIVRKIAQQQAAILLLESPPPGQAQGLRATLTISDETAPPP